MSMSKEGCIYIQYIYADRANVVIYSLKSLHFSLQLDTITLDYVNCFVG